MDGFVGRERELGVLDGLLDRVRRGGRGGRPGRAILIWGRRRVGKSRLAEEFVERAGVPYVYYTASGAPTVQADLQQFTEAVLTSNLPDTTLFQGAPPSDWYAALRLLVAGLPEDGPSVVVLDEVPYLIAADPGFEGTLQKIFDRELSRKPVLLICIGSNMAMMEAINAYGRPFHQRATEMVVPPLTPLDIAEMLELRPAEAFDAYLVSGGLPLILDEWPAGATVRQYLAEAVRDSRSAMVVSGERSLAAEFPPDSQARLVLGAIGSGERTFGMIARASGEIPHGSLNRSLRLLLERRMVEAATPLSAKASRETRYTVADPHLRFWLAFLGPYIPEIERARGDLTLARIEKSWTSWRGRAIEPVIRESLRRMTDGLPPDTAAVGGFWTRTNDVEVDLVGADREPIASKVTFVGSIKWKEKKAFDTQDLAELAAHRLRVPGADGETPMVAVSRCGVGVDGVEAVGPDRLLEAWRMP